jgi:SsrA-binding protein
MKKIKIIAKNKSARHDYYIEDTIEAGIVLTGTEVKSIRAGKMSLNESYVRINDGEVYILGMNISPYDYGTIYNGDPIRPRKLLLHRKEITKLAARLKLDGLTVIPLAVYMNSDGRVKIEIAVAKGKKNYDKRESIAKRDAERHMAQAKAR